MLSNRLAVISVIILGLCAHGTGLANGLALDDLIHIRDNFLMHLPDGGLSLLTSAAFPGNLYRPVTFWSYYAQLAITGDQYLWLHLFNILIHIANALLALSLITPLIGSTPALVAGAIFVTHPLHIESVANVSGRSELLAAFFMLLCLRSVTRMNSGRSSVWIWSLLLSFLAAASKESGSVAPLLLALWFPLAEREKRQHLVEAVMFSVAGIMLYLSLRYLVVGSIYSPFAADRFDNPLAPLEPARRGVEALTLLGVYLKKVIWPFPLSADYSYRVLHFDSALSIAGATVAALVGALAITGSVLLSRRKLAGFFVLWFFAAFILTSNLFFPIGTGFAERLCYLPSIGVIALLVHLFQRYLPPFAAGAAFVLIIISGAVYSSRHTPIWKDTVSVADYQEQVSPGSFKTRLLCAARDKNRGDFESARRHIQLVRDILPRNEDAEFLEASILIEQRDLAGAEVALQRALTINAAHAPSLNLYGRLLLNTDRLDEAEKMAGALDRVKPGSPESLMIRLASALKRGSFQHARELERRLAAMNYKSDDFLSLRRYLLKQSVQP